MKKILVVVDMQNDFIDGSLGTKEAVSIVGNVKMKIRQYHEAGDAVIFTRDTHQENYLETAEGKKLPVVHCVEGTHGWELADGLMVEGAEIINKGTFGFTGWEEYLRSYGVADGSVSIELVGLCTDICVVSNALILKALFPEADISVDAACCAGVTPESHEAALTTMRMCQINA